MANGQGPPFPNREPPLEGMKNLFTRPLLTWFRDLRSDVDAAPTQVATPVEVASSSASIGTTPIPTDPLAAGLYRVSAYVRIVVAAATSSSVSVTIAWVDEGITCSATLVPAVTGNTTASTGAGILLLRVDATSPISYSTTYASNGAGEMAYDLVLLLEAV